MSDVRVDLANRLINLPVDKRRTFLNALTQSGRMISDLALPISGVSSFLFSIVLLYLIF